MPANGRWDLKGSRLFRYILYTIKSCVRLKLLVFLTNEKHNGDASLENCVW
jgi:hypothetical protein